MSGLPFSGKTYVLDHILNNISKEVFIICPKDFRSDDYDSLDKENQREMDIAAWDASLDLLEDKINSTDNNSIVVYDTACTSLGNMMPMFMLSKQMEHKIMFIFINSKASVCKKRAGNKLSGDVIKRYVDRFIISVKSFTRSSDYYFVLDNNIDGSIPDVSNIIEIIEKN